MAHHYNRAWRLYKKQKQKTLNCTYIEQIKLNNTFSFIFIRAAVKLREKLEN